MVNQIHQTKKPTIILLSGLARSGKDSFAKFFKEQIENNLENSKYVLHIAYADYLKYICTKYLNWDGLKEHEGRTLLQVVGTDIARKNNPDIWVNVVVELVKGLGCKYDFVVISDVRFPNEVHRWKEEGFDVISVLIERLDFESELSDEQKKHISETAMSDFKFDCRIESKDLEELRNNVADFISDICFVERMVTHDE